MPGRTVTFVNFLLDLSEQVEKSDTIKGNILFNLRQLAFKIIVADGHLADEEFNFLKTVFYPARHPEQAIKKDIKEFIRANWKYEIPDFLVSFARFDRKNGASLSAKAIKVIELVGIQTIGIDNDFDAAEIEVLTEYVNFLKEFLRREGVPTEIEFEDLVDETGGKGSEGKGPFKGKGPEAGSFGDPDSLDIHLAELNGLVGIGRVKEEVVNLINLVRVMQVRKEKGLAGPNLSLEMVFLGNAGNGKRTVAGILGKMLRAVGFLSSGHLFEIDGTSLLRAADSPVSGFGGVIEGCRGGILYIGDVDKLAIPRENSARAGQAIEEILNGMEGVGEGCTVILSGSPDRTGDFLRADPVLQARFKRVFAFPDFSGDELVELMERLCRDNGFSISPESAEFLRKKFSALDSIGVREFGNVRGIRDLFQKALSKQSGRVSRMSPLSDSELTLLTDEDFN